ncbi:HAD family hydrolase [Salinibacter ruber]|uniref:HAD family hydrolase n=1 Tax=Salinibacter ruber TaxID=146919 RepID=UPI00216A5731|nr:HAD-IB family phosphatase [Salinibacter ruber]MCS4150732.1 HAD superfamily phosphoserine phosphatase-like hydrolase [Salinibacter ruber]
MEYVTERKLDVILLDFCGTLVDHQTADTFVKFCLDESPVRLTCYYALYFFQTLCGVLGIPEPVNFKHVYVRLLKNIEKEYIEQKARKFGFHITKNSSCKVTLENIRKINKKDTTLIIISAGYECYINYFSEHIDLDIDDVIASRLSYVENRCSGEIERDLIGKKKVDILAVKHRSVMDEATTTAAFSDSASDLPLLKVSDYKYVVSPGSVLENIARQKNWPVLRCR